MNECVKEWKNEIMLSYKEVQFCPLPKFGSAVAYYNMKNRLVVHFPLSGGIRQVHAIGSISVIRWWANSGKEVDTIDRLPL